MMESEGFFIVANCPECEIKFSSIEALQLHLIEQHKVIKEEPILHTAYSRNSKKSNKKLSSKFDIFSPLLSKSFPCQSCSYITKTEQLLRKHIQTQHNPHRKIYSCHLCTYFCLQERTFHLHQLKHTKLESKFACDQCGKLFLSMGIMKRHALTHSKTKPFECDVEGCNKSFNIKSRLTDHKRTVHKSCIQSNAGTVKRLPYSGTKASCKNSKDLCQPNLSHDEKATVQRISNDGYNTTKGMTEDRELISCDLSENTNSVLTENNNIFSSRPPSTSVSECDLKQQEGQQSNNNLINVYDIILPDSDSPHCGESVSKFDNFLKCGSFVHKNCLKDEQKTTWKFRCSWTGCGKTFRDSYNLRMHMCTHTGEMERSCKWCGYMCVQKSALDRHMRVHQRTK